MFTIEIKFMGTAALKGHKFFFFNFNCSVYILFFSNTINANRALSFIVICSITYIVYCLSTCLNRAGKLTANCRQKRMESRITGFIYTVNVNGINV